MDYSCLNSVHNRLYFTENTHMLMSAYIDEPVLLLSPHDTLGAPMRMAARGGCAECGMARQSHCQGGSPFSFVTILT